MSKVKATFILEVSAAAQRDLKKLPPSIIEEILFKHLPLIKEDPFGHAKPLVGCLKGERSYSFGRRPEYRIVFFIEGNTITVTIIGSRENIYKAATKRRK